MMYLWEAASEATQAEAGLAEKMGNAGLNTLMGMGVVFLVLVLISLIISAFGIIHKLEEKKDGYAILRFDQQNTPMVLDLKQFRAATPQILEKYQLPSDRSRAFRQGK